jgi:(1->4)-alpha-D-glucan 1-alpha-D-glucosylmutase
MSACSSSRQWPRCAASVTHYRLQLGGALGFDAVAALAPYLDALGVSDADLSPCFRCGPGSSHGYDVTDHNAFNPEVGSAATFDRMAAGLAARGLGLILDVVPNHMGIAGDANPWWLDVLENGQASPRAAFFDIDWTPIKPELRDRSSRPARPVRPRRVAQPSWRRGRRPPLAAGCACPSAPRPTPRSPGRPPGRFAAARRTRRGALKEIVKRRLGALAKESAEIREHLEETVRRFNGVPGDPASFDALDRLLSAQTYRRPTGGWPVTR